MITALQTVPACADRIPQWIGFCADPDTNLAVIKCDRRRGYVGDAWRPCAVVATERCAPAPAAPAWPGLDAAGIGALRKGDRVHVVTRWGAPLISANVVSNRGGVLKVRIPHRPNYCGTRTMLVSVATGEMLNEDGVSPREDVGRVVVALGADPLPQHPHRSK